MKKFLTETQVMDLIPNRFPIIYIDYVDEIESGKKIRVVQKLSQGPDHPISLFHAEGSYLKGLILEVNE